MESKSESQISEGPPRKPIVWRWTEQGYLPFIDVPYMPRKDFKAPSVDDVELMYNYLVDNKTKLAEIKKVAEDEKIQRDDFFKGAIGFSEQEKSYVTVQSYDLKRCTVMKIGSNKIIEHVFENLIYEIPVVFVIKMNNEEEPTTVELDLNIHSTLQAAILEVERNTDIMMCRVQIDGKVLDVKRTFAEKNIKPNSILFAAQVDSGAPLQKWTRLSAENLNYDNPSSFGSSHALDFIAKRNLNFFGFGMYTITKSQKTVKLTVSCYVDRIKVQEHHLHLHRDTAHNLVWEINLTDLGANPIPLQKGQTLSITFIAVDGNCEFILNQPKQETAEKNEHETFVWQEQAFDVRDSHFTTDAPQKELSYQTFPYLLYA